VKRVLVVDDEGDIRLLARLILEHNGYEVLEAASGQAALDLLKREEPDLILLDVRMPEMDGWAVLAQISDDERLRDLPVIALSAHSDATSLQRAQDLGCAGFVAKPFRMPELLEKVREATASPP